MASSSPQEIFRKSQLLTKELIKSGFDRTELRRVAAEFRTLSAETVEASTPGNRPRACRAGCSHCCWAPAYGTPIDFAEIATVLLETWSAQRLSEFRRKLDQYCSDLEAQRFEGFRRFRQPCPFLEDNLCSIYEFRPVSCRALASPGEALCQLWKSTDRVGYRVEPPNGEDRLAGVVAEGVAGAFREAGIEHAAEPMALALRNILAGQSTQEYLSSKKDGSKRVLAPWVRYFPNVPGNPTKFTPEGDADTMALLEQMEVEPQARYYRSLRNDRTRDLILRLTPPLAFQSADEIPEAMERLETAAEDALNFDNWDAKEAFAYLPLLNQIRAGYMPLPMRGWMEKLGKLLVDRTGFALAPDLFEEFEARKPGKIRIAIASFNIRAGSPASWAHGWVANLDRSLFEVTVLNLDGEEDSESFRFKDVADNYLHLAGDSLSIARFVRGLDLDYLIYPDLGDGGSNFRFAMFRLARRQATGWGCPFTSGLSTIDDYLSSDLMEPDDAQEHYSEKLVRLPNTGLTYSRLPHGLPLRTRANMGLQEGHLILLGQNLAKWLPQRDELIARISKASKNPLVLMVHGRPFQIKTLRARYERHGIRILAVQKLPLPLYLRLLELVDVSLDAPDFSGGHTTFNTLQMRTPVVTMAGEFMRSRQGLALLSRAGVPDLVARDDDEYVDLATNPERLRDAKDRMNLDALFEDVAPVRALERHILGCF